MATKVHRVDVGNRIRIDHKTPQGHARIPANLSRTGVQDYPQADGTVRREYRPPEEVFAPASLRTFDTATVVIGHPAMIDPTNWKEHAVGDIRSAKQDGKFVAAELVIRDQETLDRIDGDELHELSCGYDCMLEMTPGMTPDGEKYDAIQRDITINHVGIGPRNWGRAGSEVRLRLDGDASGVDVAYVADASDVTRPPRMTAEEIAALKAKLEASEKLAAAEKARADAAEGKLGVRTDADIAKLDGELAQAKARVKELEAKPAINVDAAVSARIAVLDGARILHGKDIANTGTDREIMIAGIVARDPDFKADGKSDEYVRGRFDFQVDAQKKAGASLLTLNRTTAPGVIDVQSHLDAAGGDAELADLMKRFDSAGDYLETYQRAEPWKNGEVAAEAAARKHLGLEH